jgi:GTP-binding protein
MEIKSADFVKGINGTDPILYNGIRQVAFVGRSNVGKSSLINALLKRKDLVKVGKKPGKTTEINFFLINKKTYFVDLPGFGYAEATPEKREKIRKLILWYLMYSEAEPLVVLVLDIKAGLTDFDKEVLEVLRNEELQYLIVANKMDKLKQQDVVKQVNSIKQESKEGEIIACSAQDKKNLHILLKKISL